MRRNYSIYTLFWLVDESDLVEHVHRIVQKCLKFYVESSTPFADLDMILLWLARYPFAATITHIILCLCAAVLANKPERLFVSNKNHKQRNVKTGYVFVVLLSTIVHSWVNIKF